MSFPFVQTFLITFLGVLPFFRTLGQGSCNPTDQKQGSEDQGGYAFQYYCGSGGRCRVFRIQNEPGKPRTPVLWKSPKEVFFDGTLEKCSPGGCEPLTITKDNSMPLYVDKTDLGWGLNQDAYKDTPDAYLESQRQEATPFPKFLSLAGPVAGLAEKPVNLGLLVGSIARRKDNVYILTYELTNTVQGQEMEFSLSERPSGKGLTVIWESAVSKQLLEYVTRNEIRGLTPQKKATIDLVAPKITEHSNLLKIFQGETLIFSTTAPAYVPD